MHRRSGIDFERLPLGQAADPGDLDPALSLAVGLADRLGDVPDIRGLIAAIVAEIAEAERKH